MYTVRICDPHHKLEISATYTKVSYPAVRVFGFVFIASFLSFLVS